VLAPILDGGPASPASGPRSESLPGAISPATRHVSTASASSRGHRIPGDGHQSVLVGDLNSDTRSPPGVLILKTGLLMLMRVPC
jgi:hypothetical protein